MTTRVREPLSVLLPDESEDTPRVSYPAPPRHSEIGIASIVVGGIAWGSLIWGFIDLVIELNRPFSGMTWYDPGSDSGLYVFLFSLGFTCAIVGIGTAVVGMFRSAGKKKTTCQIGLMMNTVALVVSLLGFGNCPSNIGW